MTEPAPPAGSASGFTMLGTDEALTCTDEACLIASVPGTEGEPSHDPGAC